MMPTLDSKQEVEKQLLLSILQREELSDLYNRGRKHALNGTVDTGLTQHPTYRRGWFQGSQEKGLKK